MIDYNSFVVPDWYLNNILKMRRNAYINKYYNTNGTFPSETEILGIVIPENEKEDIKRRYYMLRLAEEVTKNNSSDIPPVEPPQDGTVTINDILGTWEVTSVIQGDEDFYGRQFLTFTSVEKNGNVFNVWKGDGEITDYYGNAGLFALSTEVNESASKKLSVISGTNYATDSPWTNEYDITHFGFNDKGDRTMWWISKDNTTTLTFKKALTINVNNIAGTWVDINNENHIITFVRNDRTYTLQTGDTTVTGSYNLSTNEDGTVTIRGTYYHTSEEWEYRYKIKYLTETNMKWQATTNGGIVYEFVRQQ